MCKHRLINFKNGIYSLNQLELYIIPNAPIKLFKKGLIVSRDPLPKIWVTYANIDTGLLYLLTIFLIHAWFTKYIHPVTRYPGRDIHNQSRERSLQEPYGKHNK